MAKNVVFEDYSVQVKEVLKDKAIAFLHEVGGEIRSLTQRNSRRASSQTAGSFDYIVDDSGLVVHIGSNEENAIWEEFGTGIHAIHGDGRKTPWLVPVENVKGHKKPSYKGEVVIVHTDHGDCYKTDGKTANRPFQRAYDETEPRIQNIAEHHFGGI